MRYVCFRGISIQYKLYLEIEDDYTTVPAFLIIGYPIKYQMRYTSRYGCVKWSIRVPDKKLSTKM